MRLLAFCGKVKDMTKWLGELLYKPRAINENIAEFFADKPSQLQDRLCQPPAGYVWLFSLAIDEG